MGNMKNPKNEVYTDLEKPENRVLYNWVFMYNPYVKQYWAVKRDNFAQLYSGGKDILKSGDIHTLEYIIKRTDGDPKKIEKLLS